jgi:hypothetical protein
MSYNTDSTRRPLLLTLLSLLFPLFLPLLLLPLSACSAFRAVIPGGVSPSDAEWSGVKSGPVVSVVGIADPRAEAAITLLELLGQADPLGLGVLMPVTMVGEEQPRWVLCAEGKDGYAEKCRAIPLMAEVHFAGRPLGPGLLWLPTRLTASDFND